MTDAFRKVQRGAKLKIPAEAYNAFVDAVRGQRSRQHDLLQNAGDEFRQSTIIKVRNDTGQDQDRFAALAFSDPIVGPTDNLQQFKNQVNLKGVIPSDPDKRFCILLEPLAAGAIGRGIVAGATPARVSVTRETDWYAEIEPGATGYLKSGLSGPATILWKEPGTGLKWAVVLLCGGDQLVAFELIERADTLDDFPKDATLIKEDGSYGDVVKVRTPPVLTGVYGPAGVGFRGWATPKLDADTGAYTIVHMQRFAEYIGFTGANFTSGCFIPGTVSTYWHGENPAGYSGWQVWLDATHYANCTCLGQEASGIAVLDEKQSSYPILVYRVVDVDQMLQMADAGDCALNPCIPGSPTRTLIVADGLSLQTADCSDSVPCPKILSADGLTVEYSQCESSPASPGPYDSSTDGVRTLSFREPLIVTPNTGCPASAEVKLPDDLISSSCLQVQKSNCKYVIDLPPDLITPGSCINVTQTGCTYEVGLDPACLAGKILPGTCISVNDNGDGSVTVNNTMTLTAGAGIAISGDCNKTISATGLQEGIQPGDCISFDVDGNTTTINSTVNVTGGNGILVTKSDCDYMVSLAGGHGDPKTSVRFVCDIECVQAADGSWSLQVKYGTLELPTAIVAGYSSECDGGSGSGGSGSTPIYTCDDCPDCGEGVVIIKEDGSECDCLATTPENPDAPAPDGWIRCDGAEGSVTFEDISCDGDPPHFAYTVNQIPDGASGMVITVTGDKGSSATVGGATTFVAGQNYWGALVDSWGDPQPGECFTFSAQWQDASGDPVGDPITWEACCD